MKKKRIDLGRLKKLAVQRLRPGLDAVMLYFDSEPDPALLERAQTLGCEQAAWLDRDGKLIPVGLRQDGSIVDLATGEVVDDGLPDVTINLIEPNQQ